MRKKMNWLSFENRIREALRQSEGENLDSQFCRELLVRLDTIVAAETRRGYALSDETRARLAGNELQEIEDSEWNKGP